MGGGMDASLMPEAESLPDAMAADSKDRFVIEEQSLVQDKSGLSSACANDAPDQEAEFATTMMKMKEALISPEADSLPVAVAIGRNENGDGNSEKTMLDQNRSGEDSIVVDDVPKQFEQAMQAGVEAEETSMQPKATSMQPKPESLPVAIAVGGNESGCGVNEKTYLDRDRSGVDLTVSDDAPEQLERDMSTRGAEDASFPPESAGTSTGALGSGRNETGNESGKGSLSVDTAFNTDVPTQVEQVTLPSRSEEVSLSPEAEPLSFRTVTGTNENGSGKNPDDQSQSGMDLNVAYEALEQVRRANVDIEFGECIDPSRCLPCLREEASKRGGSPVQAGRRWGRVRRNLPRNKTAPCLTCGIPLCPRHRCPAFYRENISICLDCSKFFSYDFMVDSVMICTDSPEEDRRRLMGSMLDVYDRSLLVLEYSSRYFDDVASALERNTRRNDRIGLGSSATGFASGIAGVAAAATIFTPVGPPLLIASILFGGGATAVSAGSEAVNYRCEPNRMADRIIVLRDIVHSISRLVSTPEVDGVSEEGGSGGGGGDVGGIKGVGGKRKVSNTTMISSRNWTRATANALKPLTAGALSAASVVMEAREMRATLQKIHAGHPCEKAEALRTIRKEIERFPQTQVLAKECRKYFLLGNS